MSKKNRKVKTLWFKAKEYGWGWYPASWQGWAVTAGFAAFYTLSLLGFLAWAGAATEAKAELKTVTLGILEYLALLVLATYTLIRTCIRFGESPRWRWGKKNEERS